MKPPPAITPTRRLYLIFAASLLFLTLPVTALLFAAPPLQSDADLTATALYAMTLTALPTRDGPAPEALTATAAATREALLAQATADALTSPSVPLVRFKHTAPVTGAFLDSSGARLFTWDTAGTVKLWDFESGAELATLVHGHELVTGGLGIRHHSIALNPAETRLLVWSNGSTLDVSVWDVEARSPAFGTQLFALQQPDNPQFAPGGGAAWSPDGALIVTWSRSDEAHLWDAATGADRAYFVHNNIIWGADFNSDGSKLLTWSTDSDAVIWDVATLLTSGPDSRQTHSSAGIRLTHRSLVNGARWSEDETRVLTWSFDNYAAIWDAATGHPLGIFPHTDYVWSALWQGDRLLTTGLDGYARVWDTSALDPARVGITFEPVNQITSPGPNFVHSTRRPASSLAASWGNGALVVWDTITGAVHFTKNFTAATALWSLDGAYLLTIHDGVGQVWGGVAGEAIVTIAGAGNITGGLWLPTGDLLVWEDGGQVTRWQLSPVTIAQVPNPSTPTPTVLVTTEQPPSAPSATATPLSGGRLLPDRVAAQSFIATSDTITAVDLRLIPWPAIETRGDVLTVRLTDLNRTPLASAEQFVPAGFTGWLRLEFPAGVPVTPGFSYVIEVQSAYTALNGDPNLAWVLDRNDPYPDGVGGSGSAFFIWYDYAHRLNAPDPDATVLPPVTVTPTPTHTPIPPPLTATVEAGFQRNRIYAGFDPRTAALLDIPTGGSLDLLFGYEECCYFINEATAIDVTWAITDTGGIAPQDVSIDADGLLTVAEDAAVGTVAVTVSAGGNLTQTVTVNVYSPQLRPYVGVWREEARLNCTSGAWETDTIRFYEVIFTADGRLSVSFAPFEVFVDYVGQYTAAEGTITLSPRMLNYLPPDVDGSGTYALDDAGRLELRGIYLGSSQYGEEDELACGHRLERAGS